MVVKLLVHFPQEKYPLSDEDIKRLDRDNDNKITKKDLDIFDELLNSKYSGLLRVRADINGDTYVDEEDYIALQEILEQGYTIVYDKISKKDKKIDLKQYNIPFILGYCDVQTEAIIEADLNSKGLISEVSK